MAKWIIILGILAPMITASLSNYLIKRSSWQTSSKIRGLINGFVALLTVITFILILLNILVVSPENVRPA